jgi:hypothetical protein
VDENKIEELQKKLDQLENRKKQHQAKIDTAKRSKKNRRKYHVGGLAELAGIVQLTNDADIQHDKLNEKRQLALFLIIREFLESPDEKKILEYEKNAETLLENQAKDNVKSASAQYISQPRKISLFSEIAKKQRENQIKH